VRDIVYLERDGDSRGLLMLEEAVRAETGFRSFLERQIA